MAPAPADRLVNFSVDLEKITALAKAMQQKTRKREEKDSAGTKHKLPYNTMSTDRSHAQSIMQSPSQARRT
jgi:hypothetical protein